MTFREYTTKWLEMRKRDFPRSTYEGDFQRIRDYLMPILGDYKMAEITMPLCKHALTKIFEPNFRPGITISSGTRDRVKAVLSGIMSAAINEYPPVIEINPVRDIRFSERRKGKRRPRTLESRDECIKFIETAKMIGHLEFMIASIFLMTGCRKQELIALRWNSFDSDKKTLHIKEKYEQASGLILKGTKAGENVNRTVPISQNLVDLLISHKQITSFKSDTDFILCGKTGVNLSSRQVSIVVENVRKKASLNISAHGLRHSFGRLFVESGGNIKVLQGILGHSSSSITDLYSDLSGKRIEGFGEVINLKADNT